MRLLSFAYACLLIVAGSDAAPAQSPPLRVLGYAGVLGEWELTAITTETRGGRTQEFSGPFTMKHVGICSQDGPEEKSGEIRLRISAGALDVSLSVAGGHCSFQSRSSNPYTGTLTCSDRAPIPLTLWIE